ncbi:MAG: hypothetical protein ACO1HP_03690, partial [Bacteroidota bacterium]
MKLHPSVVKWRSTAGSNGDHTTGNVTVLGFQSSGCYRDLFDTTLGKTGTATNAHTVYEVGRCIFTRPADIQSAAFVFLVNTGG